MSKLLRGFNISFNKLTSCNFYVYWSYKSEFISCFEKYNIQIDVNKGRYSPHDSEDTYDIAFENNEDVCKAVIVMLIENAFGNISDGVFCEYTNGCIQLMSEINQSVLGILPVEFKKLLLNKNTELKKQRDKLIVIAQKLSIPKESMEAFTELTYDNELEAISTQNFLLLEANNLLYGEIIRVARELTISYNTEAAKTAVTATITDCLQQQHSELLKETEEAIKEGSQKPQEGGSKEAKTLIPSEVPINLGSHNIHSYIEPTVEFPSLSKIKVGYESDNKHLTITKNDIITLENKIDKLHTKKQEIRQSTSLFTRFFQTVKTFLPYIYSKITAALKSVKSAACIGSEHKNLKQDFEQVVDGKPVTSESVKIHRYNSRPSPLIAIIHASEDLSSEDYLSPKEKLYLLKELAEKKPCRSLSSKSEQNTNINIDGGTPKNKGSLELKTIWQRSPLHHAVEFGSSEMVEILSSAHGVDINKEGDQFDLLSNISGDQVSPLHVAVAQGCIDKVKILLAHGASVNVKNKEGQTPLHSAEDPTIAQLLIDHGANVAEKDNHGNTPLHLAAQRNNAAAATVMLRQFQQIATSPNVPNQDGNTPLHLAAHIGFPASFSYQSPSLFSVSGTGEKQKNNISIIFELVKAGCDVNTQNNFGYTPLHMAALSGTQVAGDENVSLSVDHSGTYYHNRYDYNHIKEKVLVLCKLGAKVDICSYDMWRKSSQTETSYSQEFEHRDDWKNHPAPNSTPLMALYSYRAKKRFDVSEKDQPLCVEIANIMSADVKISQLNLDAKYASLDREENDSFVHACAMAADSNGLQYFLEQGMDANYQVSETRPTPLHILMHWNATHYGFSSGAKACIDVLLAHGADINKTMLYKLKIDHYTSILADNKGFCLSDSTVAAIFKHDNIISQTAKMKNLTVTQENSREVLKQIYESLGSREINIPIPMTPVEYGQIYKNGDLNACAQAVSYLEEQAQKSQFGMRYCQ